MFTNCLGDCFDCLIHYKKACWAGHGDDEFTQITKDNIKLISDKEERAKAQLRLKGE
jgi:hypothetical protein